MQGPANYHLDFTQPKYPSDSLRTPALGQVLIEAAKSLDRNAGQQTTKHNKICKTSKEAREIETVCYYDPSIALRLYQESIAAMACGFH